MRTRLKYAVPSLLVLLFCAFMAPQQTWAAFSVEPFVLRLDMARGQTTGWVELAPMVDYRPVPVEVQVFERVVDESGAELFDTPLSKDLIVYPSEVILFPGQKVKVQVSWAHKKAPNSDRSYALVLSEVPLPVQNAEQGEAQAQMQTLARFRAVVALETGKSGQLAVVSAKKSTDGKVEILVENRGQGRVPLEGMQLIIRGQKYSHFTGANGNSIMPGQKRRFELELPFIPTASDIRYGQGN